MEATPILIAFPRMENQRVWAARHTERRERGGLRLTLDLNRVWFGWRFQGREDHILKAKLDQKFAVNSPQGTLTRACLDVTAWRNPP